MAQDFQPAGLAANLTDAGCQVGPNQMITAGRDPPYESAAMWSLYAKQGLGVAVKTTIPRLLETLTGGLASLVSEVIVGEVHFVD